VPDDEDDFELKKGQELKFLVVTDTGSDGSKEKHSARNVECLPEGSVLFHKDVAHGIKGIVEVCPRPPIGSDDMYGTIRLVDPVSDGEEEVKNVLLEFSDAPGETYTYKQHSKKHSSTMGLWIENGDTLLFDVVKELADGSYRAAPTRHTLGEGSIVQPPNEANAGTPTVRLCACSLVHRADGVVHTVKESSGYGFLHFSERPIDVHFKTFNFLPEELQSDLRKQLGYDGKPVRLESGTAVQFDICSHGTVSHHTGGRRGHERENIKGHRILLLPRSAVTMEKVIKKEVKGVIKSVNAKQIYSGAIDLEEDLELMTIEDRHPLVAQMIHSFLEESSKPNGRKSLVFRDIVSVKEDDIVVEMVKLLGGGLLDCSHIAVAGSSLHPGRLCIRRVEEEEDEGANEEDVEGKEKPTQKKNKPINSRQVHYDKSSLTDELKEDIPPGSGDIVTFDVSQSRRTGRFVVHNLTVVERNESTDIAEVSNEGSGLGIVREVVPKRNFGFISVLDETATKRESLFFQLSNDKDSKKSMYRKGDEVKFDVGLEKSGKRLALNVQLLSKGTIPVKAAKNACQGLILMEPSHTSLSDTPLRKKFSHMSTGSDKSGGRWDDAKEDSKTKSVDSHEKGCILLLEDKTGMFKRKGRRVKNSASVPSNDDDDAKSVDSFDSRDDAGSLDSFDSGDEGKSTNGEGVSDEEPFAYVHLPYKNGAIAIHGSGSTSSMDGSTNPRRGDLVSFVRRGSAGVRDVRIVTRQPAKFIQGRLENIESIGNSAGLNRGKAKFIAATQREEEYEVDLGEVVSCDASALKEKQTVEAILHEGRLYGVCRTVDLYLGSKMGILGSKMGTKNKERPKLNLSVKKNRGGTIMAQSMMAKVCLMF
jgi:cold shock CspA family protein